MAISIPYHVPSASFMSGFSDAVSVPSARTLTTGPVSSPLSTSRGCARPLTISANESVHSPFRRTTVR